MYILTTDIRRGQSPTKVIWTDKRIHLFYSLLTAHCYLYYKKIHGNYIIKFVLKIQNMQLNMNLKLLLVIQIFIYRIEMKKMDFKNVSNIIGGNWSDIEKHPFLAAVVIKVICVNII